MGVEPDSDPVLDAETRARERPADHQAELRLWLRLLTCSTLIEGEIRTRLRERFYVTLPRFDLMAQLEKVPDGMTLGELSRRMMVSNGNITGLVERLVQQGLLLRTPHPTDRRAAFVRLTPAGHGAFAVMAEQHADWIATLFDGLADADIRLLMQLLARMKQSVRDAIEVRKAGRC
jgi:DNA-binding MarR family transcriptional regulator